VVSPLLRKPSLDLISGSLYKQPYFPLRPLRGVRRLYGSRPRDKGSHKLRSGTSPRLRPRNRRPFFYFPRRKRPSKRRSSRGRKLRSPRPSHKHSVRLLVRPRRRRKYRRLRLYRSRRLATRFIHIQRRKTNRSFIKNPLTLKLHPTYKLPGLRPTTARTVTIHTPRRSVTTTRPFADSSGTLNHLVVPNRHIPSAPLSRVRLSRPGILPRKSSAFVFRNIGAFLVTKPLNSQNLDFHFKFRTKKRLFSFLAPNQAKKTIMLRKRRIITHKTVYGLRKRFKTRSRFSYLFFKKLNRRSMKPLLYAKSLHSYALETSDLFTPDALSTNRLLGRMQGYELSRDEIVSTPSFYNRGPDTAFRTGEVRIPRIRFKPGYQRI
jgi:hypothetical protein